MVLPLAIILWQATARKEKEEQLRELLGDFGLQSDDEVKKIFGADVKSVQVQLPYALIPLL